VILGNALSLHGNFDDAATVLREAIRLKADSAEAHSYLGGVLKALGKIDEAVAECREAIRLKPDLAEFHVSLGVALAGLPNKEKAIAEHRLAQRLNPDYPEAHCSLSMILYESGDYAGAAAELRAGQELRCKRAGKPYSSTGLIDNVERLAALAARLPAIMSGKDRPKDTNEKLSFARMAYDRKFYAAAALLWEEALDAQPVFGECRTAVHRYNAACAAALAAAGQGENNPSHDSAARAKLRQQAVAWLKAELDAWSKLFDSGKPADRDKIVQNLQHWLGDPDLATLRGPESLAKLPEAERAEMRTLWEQVSTLLAKAREQPGARRP
jgi:tetratricopeptide (TPR) repeat protein